MRYRLAMFDFDGTLADTLSWFLTVMDQVAERYGIRHVSPEEREMLRGYDVPQLLAHLGIPVWKMPIIATHVQALMTQRIDHIALFPGVSEALQHLHTRGMTLAVVSSNSETNVRGVLGPQIAALMSYYECGVALFGKAVKLRHVLRQTGVARSQAIYIGDEIRDAQASRTAGIDFGAVSWGYNRVEALKAQSATVVFTTPADIARLSEA